MKLYMIMVSALSMLFSIFISGCSGTKVVDPGYGRIVYSNSFESSADTVGWTGYGTIQFKNDVPPGGGKHSLYVSGACMVPHAQFKIGLMLQGGSYIIRCWGKNLANGGGVFLGVGQNSFEGKGIYVSVSDTNWTLYQTAETLFCPADSSLWITMVSGGIVYSAMLVDEVQVVRVN